MKTAHYLEFKTGSNPTGTCIGGRPAETPTKWPWAADDHEVMGFSVQICVADLPFELPGVRWIQLYQSIDEGDDPMPVVVVIRVGEQTKTGDLANSHPRLEEHTVRMHVKDDPDVMTDLTEDPDGGRFFLSKLGGVDPWNAESENGRFLGQLHEGSGDLDFGGCDCGLYLRSEGDVKAVLR